MSEIVQVSKDSGLAIGGCERDIYEDIPRLCLV